MGEEKLTMMGGNAVLLGQKTGEKMQACESPREAWAYTQAEADAQVRWCFDVLLYYRYGNGKCLITMWHYQHSNCRGAISTVRGYVPH